MPSRSASRSCGLPAAQIRQDVDGIDVAGQPPRRRTGRRAVRWRVSYGVGRKMLLVLHLLGVTDHYNGGRVRSEPHPTRKHHDERAGKRGGFRAARSASEGAALQACMLVRHRRMIASTQPRVRIVVLAAGSSTRLGSPKTLARVRGTSLIRNTVRLLAPLVHSPIIIVTPARAARLRAELRGLPVRLVQNPQRAQGLSTSVRRGLAAACPAAAVLLLPVDLARFREAGSRRLLSRWRASRRRLVATRFGGYGGARLIVPRWLHAQALTISGDRGLRDLVSRLTPENLTLLKLPTAVADVDTPQDLKRARRRSSR